MQKLTKHDTKEIIAGDGAGFWLCISAGVIFFIGLIDGIVRPYKCR